MDALTWIFQNAERLTVAGLLAFALLGRFREWWVDGPTYRVCRTKLERLEANAETEAQRTAERLQAAETELASLRQMTSRRRSS